MDLLIAAYLIIIIIIIIIIIKGTYNAGEKIEGYTRENYTQKRTETTKGKTQNQMDRPHYK